MQLGIQEDQTAAKQHEETTKQVVVLIKMTNGNGDVLVVESLRKILHYTFSKWYLFQPCLHLENL